MPEREEQNRRPDCTDVAELLPFYLNRSLEEAEARRVEAHLGICAACRREERDARTAWALYEGHLPVEMLLDYALGRPMSSRRLALVESHLNTCERCTAEVATVRDENPMPRSAFRRSQSAGQASSGRLRALAWAACLAAIVASAGWIWTWRQLVDERALSAPRTARANFSVVELLPATQTLLRQSGTDLRAAVNRVEPYDHADELVLVLLSGGHSCNSGCIVEVYEGEESQPTLRVEGLVPGPDGHLTLGLPGDWLPPDRSVLAVRDQDSGELVAEYVVEILNLAEGAR